MSHEDIAAVWSVLHGRQDIDHVFRELVGVHFLNVSLARRDSSRLREAFLTHTVTLQTIFDLQRSYLQSSIPSRESVSSLLPHDLLFSAVLHLLDVIVAGCISCSGLSTEEPYNRVTAHTTLSGLRALLLHRKPLAAREHELLHGRFEEVYERGHWHGTEHTLILRLCRQAIQVLVNGRHDDRSAEPACSAASLPDFFAGLYRFQGYERPIVDASQRIGGVSLQSSTWFCDCLTLYDLYWSTTAALIQLCLVRRRVQENTNNLSNLDNFNELSDFLLVLNTRFQLQKQIFSSTGVAQVDWTVEQLRGLILQNMRPACAEERCKCLEPDSSIIQELRLQHGVQPYSFQYPGKEFSDNSFNSEISKALRQFHSFLERRSATSARPRIEVAIPRVNSFDTTLSRDGRPEVPVFKRAATTPNGEIPRKEVPPRQHRPPLSYSVSSPAVDRPTLTPSSLDHHLATSGLASTVANTHTVIVQRQSSNKSSYTNTSNPETTIGSEVFSHQSAPLSSVGESPRPQFRQIDRDNFPEVHQSIAEEPLRQKPSPVPIAIESFPEAYNPTTKSPVPGSQQPQPWQPDRDNYLEVAPSHSLTIAAPSIISEESDGSRSPFRAETAYSKPKKWQGLFSSSRTQSSSSPPSSTFFASGSSLLIWNDAGAGIYDLNNTDSMQFRRINASSVCAAVGGKNRCAVIVKGISEYRLEVYEGPCDVPIREWKLESMPYAIAFSLNDNSIAAKYSRTVRIFQIDNGGSFRHDLPPQNSRSGRGNHVIAFSTDSLSFVATTRYEPEKVITYWSECNNSSKATFVESTAPTGFPGDNGLSSLVCSNTNIRAAFLTTFTEKGFPTFLSLTSAKLSSHLIRDSKGRIGARIHRAALCPTGTSLVLLNQRNDLFWVDDCWTGMQEPRKVGTIKRSVSVMREVEVGMPNSDEVHLFWVEKGKGMLVTMGRGGGKTKPIEIVVDLEVLVA